MKTKKLAFALSNQVSYYREIVEGIGDFMQHKPEWEMLWQGQHLFWKGAEVWSSGADAVVCGALDTEDREKLQHFKGRPISVSNRRRQPFVDCVVSDDREVGREAGRHLTRLGFRQLAFVNFSNAFFSSERFAGANEVFEMFPESRVREFPVLNPDELPERVREMCDQFRSPFAIYCDTDLPAVKLAGIAEGMGLRIPEDAALLGTDNAPLLCQFCRPRLSSVALDPRGISRRICEELEREPDTQCAPLRIEIPPLGVVARHSTDITAIEDRRIAGALSHMRSRKGKDLTVDEVARVAGMSRRLLELKFKELLHRSPYQEMLHLRIDHARDLLKRSDMAIGAIAEEAGFEDIRAFNKAFLKQVGQSPRQYRKGDE